MARPRVIVADDQEEWLADITALLAGEFDIVGVARDGATIVDMATRLRPDAVVTDLKMPRLNGLEAGCRLIAEKVCTAVVVLTVCNDPQLAKVALDMGIQGYVLKANAVEELAFAVRRVLKGETFVSPQVAPAEVV